LTFAFSQLVHAGNFWSQRFFLNRHRLHALTLRKFDDEAEEDAPLEAAPAATPPSPEPPSAASSAASEVACGLARFFLLDDSVGLFISRCRHRLYAKASSAKRLRGDHHRGSVCASVPLHRNAHTRVRKVPRRVSSSLGLWCSDSESNLMTMTRRAILEPVLLCSPISVHAR
jgi:hypothetical protein